MTKLDNFKSFFWDSQSRKFLGRTGDSWAKLVAFYITLYSCLAAIWSIYFHIFHLTISDKYPKWQLEESLIGTNPGLGLRPQSPRHRVESALISFRAGPEGDYEHWVADLREFIEVTNKVNDTSPATATSATATNPTRENCNPSSNLQDIDSYCPFDGSSIPPECTAAQNYSFPQGKPCLLVKLNRIYGWKPEPYDTPPDDYPSGAPFAPGKIQVTCEGQNDPDKEHVGPVSYFPANGIETKYYPFYNQLGYQSPYVMVHFESPKLNTLIYVECKAWAKNIQHDRYNRKGMATFELFIEKSSS